MSDAPSLSLDRIAALRAELDTSDQPEAVLAREHVPQGVWSAALESLLDELADEVDRSDTARAERFADVYEETRSKLLGTAPGDRPPRSKPEPIDLSAGSSAPELDVDATGMTDNRAVVQALKARGLPFDPSAAPAPPPPPAPMEPKDQSGETVEVDATEIRATLRAMGIGGDERAPAPAPIAPPSAPQAPAPSPAPEPAPPLVSFPEPEPPSPPPPPTTDPPDVDGTQEMDAAKVREALASRGVPFAQPPAAAPAARGTEKLDLSEFQAKLRALQALPMPMERFAALQAELSRSADRAATLRARGVDPATWPAVLRAFGEAMKLHPNLREQYERLLQQATNR
jgi:hypothetical protein